MSLELKDLNDEQEIGKKFKTKSEFEYMSYYTYGFPRFGSFELILAGIKVNRLSKD